KMDPKSLACVFVGYNEKYKGYHYLYPPTGRVFISRHVLFDEHSFPFADVYSKYHKHSQSTLLNSWRAASILPQTSSPQSTELIEEDLPARQAQCPHPPVHAEETTPPASPLPPPDNVNAQQDIE